MPPRSARVIMLVAVVVTFAGCAGGGGDQQAQTETQPTTAAETQPATAPETATAESVETDTVSASETSAAGDDEGHGLYLEAGCGSCHGENAEGTGVGPALAGHTAEQVLQQVRNPLAQMPSYTEAQLSRENLDAIAQYITGLEPAEEHVEPVELSNPVATHHWMALSAIDANDPQDALHHVGHIIEAVTGEHREQMERARDLLRAGELHEAEHLIEEMLAGTAEPMLGLDRLHLRFALVAVDQRAVAEARHHMRHFLETATGEQRRQGEVVLDHLREGDLHSAEHGIADLLGVERD